MDKSALALLLTDFAFIGALPRIFFRRDGRLNLKWWLTALPFFMCPALLTASAFGVLVPMTPRSWAVGMAVAATVFAAFSIALLCYTLGTHQIPIALWHQNNDDPQHIVTTGAYRVIRHPFYTSFLLAAAATVLLLPHVSTLLVFFYAAVRLNATAAREERRLSGSKFGAEYQEYIRRTGRFVPKRTVRRAVQPRAA
jgi:protein-S-isoprenylcysteine O-methyltransferase Ste14